LLAVDRKRKAAAQALESAFSQGGGVAYRSAIRPSAPSAVTASLGVRFTSFVPSLIDR
jgi:hypothetical protein